MKFLTFMTLEEINKVFDRFHRRIRALENETSVSLPTSAPTNPADNQMWLDAEAGKLNVWNGSSWDKWSKD